MTTDEFNEKWKDHLEKDHYGLAIDHKEVIEYLHNIFSYFKEKYPDFTYSQIKLKFGRARVYMEGIPRELNFQIEEQINNLLQ